MRVLSRPRVEWGRLDVLRDPGRGRRPSVRRLGRPDDHGASAPARRTASVRRATPGLPRLAAAAPCGCSSQPTRRSERTTRAGKSRASSSLRRWLLPRPVFASTSGSFRMRKDGQERHQTCTNNVRVMMGAQELHDLHAELCSPCRTMQSRAATGLFRGVVSGRRNMVRSSTVSGFISFLSSINRAALRMPRSTPFWARRRSASAARAAANFLDLSACCGHSTGGSGAGAGGWPASVLPWISGAGALAAAGTNSGQFGEISVSVGTSGVEPSAAGSSAMASLTGSSGTARARADVALPACTTSSRQQHVAPARGAEQDQAPTLVLIEALFSPILG